jgi:hypothetical protein
MTAIQVRLLTLIVSQIGQAWVQLLAGQPSVLYDIFYSLFLKIHEIYVSSLFIPPLRLGLNCCELNCVLFPSQMVYWSPNPW